jgi:hypothetical protein
MISPLIKWDHSEDHFVTRYEAKISKSERTFAVNIGEHEYEFVSGHTIDGEKEMKLNASMSLFKNLITFRSRSLPRNRLPLFGMAVLC